MTETPRPEYIQSALRLDGPNHLAERERRLLHLRAAGKTRAETAQALDVTTERIKQLEQIALSRLFTSAKDNPNELLLPRAIYVATLIRPTRSGIIHTTNRPAQT